MQRLLQKPAATAIDETSLQGQSPSSSALSTCLACGAPLKRATNQRHHYLESGLKTVWLEGVTVHDCNACKERYTEIPNVDRLHRFIAKAIVEKRFALVGPEFRFLRKQMRMKSREIAIFLGVTLTTISRWETGAERIGAANDRLMRSLYMFWRLKQDDVKNSAQTFERLNALFSGLSVRPRAQAITVNLAALKSSDVAD